jgi:glycosyltransferase involved in cell wall biosynthesis
LASIKSQRTFADEIEVIVVADEGDEAARRIFDEVSADRPLWRFVEHPATDGGYGYPQRARGLAVASGEYLLFIDDDDVYTRRAFARISQAVTANPGRIVIFRMDIHGSLRWRTHLPVLREKNVGMEMVAIPNIRGKLGGFASPLRYASDFDFIAETVAIQGDPVWRKDVIVIFNQPPYLARPRTGGPVSRFLFRVGTGRIFLPLRLKLRIRSRARSARSRLQRGRKIGSGPPAR